MTTRATERHTALIDSLAAELFPFQESEEEQESFTDVGRARVDDWLARTLAASRREALEALELAVKTIRTWHGMGLGRNEAQAWALYQASPEMKKILAALEQLRGESK